MKKLLALALFTLSTITLSFGQAQGAAGQAVPTVAIANGISDGVNLQVPLAASATTLTAATNNKIALSEKGARWFIASAPASGSQATVAKAAGGAGVRHVVDCIGFSAAATAAVTAANTTVTLSDGTSTFTFAVAFPTASAAGVQEVLPFSACGLSFPFAANTAVTIQFTAAVTGAAETVFATGFDVQ